jgi:ligand-binding sensor domain-containing protein
VWIGTQHGLNCFDPETRRFDRFFYSAINKKSINDNVVNCIFEDSNGALWIGTNAGLNKKEIAVGADGNPIVQFIAFPDQPWITNQVVMILLEDDHKTLDGIYNGL